MSDNTPFKMSYVMDEIKRLKKFSKVPGKLRWISYYKVEQYLKFYDVKSLEEFIKDMDPDIYGNYKALLFRFLAEKKEELKQFFDAKKGYQITWHKDEIDIPRMIEYDVKDMRLEFKIDNLIAFESDGIFPFKWHQVFDDSGWLQAQNRSIFTSVDAQVGDITGHKYVKYMCFWDNNKQEYNSVVPNRVYCHIDKEKATEEYNKLLKLRYDEVKNRHNEHIALAASCREVLNEIEQKLK